MRKRTVTTEQRQERRGGVVREQSRITRRSKKSSNDGPESWSMDDSLGCARLYDERRMLGLYKRGFEVCALTRSGL